MLELEASRRIGGSGRIRSRGGGTGLIGEGTCSMLRGGTGGFDGIFSANAGA